MTWVLIYLGIALAGVVMVGCFAFWLWRKATALLRELGVLLERVDDLAGVLEQIGQPVESRAQGFHRLEDENAHGGYARENHSSRSWAT